MQRTFYLLLILVSGSLLSCAQGKYGIGKMQAYITTRIPGNIPVNPQGEPLHAGPDSLYIIYAETNKEISWDSAWMGGKRYAITAVQATEIPVHAGLEPQSGKPVMLTPAPGYSLWILQLDTSPAEPDQNRIEPPGKDLLMIRGRQGKKTIIRGFDKLPVLNLTSSV